jgi:SSS family solute:Na+ symporter
MDTNLNSMATLTLTDFYRRVRPNAGDREQLKVLHVSTGLWGLACIGFGLIMTLKVGATVDFSWKVAGLLGGGLLGLFLLGLMTKAGSKAAAGGVIAGVVLILWMTLSKMPIWPAAWSGTVSPFHDLFIPIAGTVTVLGVGWLLGLVDRRPAAGAAA